MPTQGNRQHVNRRRMLKTAGMGVAGWLMTAKLPALEDTKKLQFVIVSDTHLGRKDNDLAERQWRQSVGEINSLPGQFVLHLGDVVDGGRPEQYPIYSDSRILLDKPIYEVPGNHDPVELFTRHVSRQTDRVLDHGPFRFLLFNNAHRDSHDGFITSEQLAWLDEACRDAERTGQLIIICCHVPVHSNKHPDRGWYVKPDQGQTSFYELLTRHGERIIACLHGHFHNGIRGWRDHGRTIESLCPSVCYNQNRGLTEHLAAGRADGFFIDELRPGYLLAEIGAGQFKLQYKPVGVPVAATFRVKL